MARAETPAEVHRVDEGLPVALITPALRESPPSIEAVERRRAHLWIVAALFLLATSTVILLLFIEGEDVHALIPDAPALRWTFLALTCAFLLYVVDQERRLRRLTAALIEERVLSSALRARVTDLATLTKVGRVVNSVLTREEVLETILESLFELTGATSGSVMLVADDHLEVAVSAGSRQVRTGVRLALGEGVAGWVASKREPLLINGRLEAGQFPGHGLREATDEPGSSVVAPLIVGDEVLGVLAVEREAGRDPFVEAELRSVAVFAEHAATAVHNAQRYDAERETVERLADALEQRAEFVATMVHELKTPMTVILGFASLLEQRWDQLDERRRAEVLTSMRTQGERIQGMVGEILRAASVEAGAEPQWERIDVASLATETIDHIGALAEEREQRARLIRLVGADADTIVQGDRDALARILENLLENAVKYSPPGSPVLVRLETDPDEVVVHVSDRGPGIDESEIESLFERFRRSERSPNGGVGLGLYIVRTLVHAHRGRVWATVNEEGGSTFSFAIPRRMEPAGFDVPFERLPARSVAGHD